MTMQHRISAVLTPADKAAIIAKLNEIRALVPFLISLSPRERQSLTKLGNKTASFDGKCRDYMAQHPKLVPRFLDMAEFQRDRDLLDAVSDLHQRFAGLAQEFADTRLMLGHEVLSPELAFYKSTAQAAKRDVLDAQTIYDDLKGRFPGGITNAAKAKRAQKH